MSSFPSFFVHCICIFVTRSVTTCEQQVWCLQRSWSRNPTREKGQLARSTLVKRNGRWNCDAELRVTTPRQRLLLLDVPWTTAQTSLDLLERRYQRTTLEQNPTTLANSSGLGGLKLVESTENSSKEKNCETTQLDYFILNWMKSGEFGGC
jgi:hypothetical protein